MKNPKEEQPKTPINELFLAVGRMRADDPAYADAIAKDNAKTYAAIQAPTITPDGEDSRIRVHSADNIEGFKWRAAISRDRCVAITGLVYHEHLRLLCDFARDVGGQFLRPDWVPYRDWGIDKQLTAITGRKP